MAGTKASHFQRIRYTAAALFGQPLNSIIGIVMGHQHRVMLLKQTLDLIHTRFILRRSAGGAIDACEVFTYLATGWSHNRHRVYHCDWQGLPLQVWEHRVAYAPYARCAWGQRGVSRHFDPSSHFTPYSRAMRQPGNGLTTHAPSREMMLACPHSEWQSPEQETKKAP